MVNTKKNTLLEKAKESRNNGDVASSLKYLQSALRIDKTDVVTAREFHISILSMGRLSTNALAGAVREYTEFFESTILEEPTNLDLYYCLSQLYSYAGRTGNAVTLLETVAKLLPDCAVTAFNLACALKDDGKPEFALDCLRNIRAPDIDLELKIQRCSAHIFFQLGMYGEAWDNYEPRWQKESKDRTMRRYLDGDLPTWAGDKDQRLCIWPEQGLGEEIMFASVLNEVARISKNLSVICDPRLIPVFKRSFPSHIKFLPKNQIHSHRDYDAQIPIASLPRLFLRKHSDFAREGRQRYLLPDQKKVSKIRSDLMDYVGGEIIGLSWFSESINPTKLLRNVPLDELISLAKAPQRKFVSLQYGDTQPEITRVRNIAGVEVLDPVDIEQFNDISGLCNLIAACDHIVSIDNVTVHLSGAMGIPTTALIPSIPDWRWGLNSETTAWYRSVRLIRQTKSLRWPDFQLWESSS